MHIPVFKPFIDDKEINAATEALENGWLGMGSYVGQFEKSVESLFNDELHAVALSTGHAALHLALLDLGLPDKDEVITASFNNIADFQAILAVGAKPVFADILEDTLCVNPESVKKLITQKTKAIIIMDYASHFCEYEAFLEIKKNTGIPIIHDAAHSFGGYYKDKILGGMFDYTMFSFDPVKTITCIDGGMLLVNNAETVTHLQERRLVGMGQSSKVMYRNKRAWTYDVKRLGFRYHMANLHAAIGLAQLRKLPSIFKKRKQNFEFYQQKFNQLSGCIANPILNEKEKNSLPFSYYLRIKENKRKEFIDYMGNRGIDIGIHWQPGHNFTLFKEYKRDDLTITDSVAVEIVTLPFHTEMSHETLEYVSDAVIDFASHS